jgi:hypothetical protein
MADEDRSDSNLWFFLLGLVVGVLISGGGAFSFFAYRQARIGKEIREMQAVAEVEAEKAHAAMAEAEKARKDAEDQRARAEAALKKAKEKEKK